MRNARSGYEVVQAVLALCRKRSIPEPDRIARSALGQQTKNLLRGGYDLADIRETALDLTSEFTLYTRHKALMSLQQRVQQKYDDARIREHETIVGPVFDPEHPRDHIAARRAVRVVSPKVAVAMGAPLEGFTGATSEYDGEWKKRCTRTDCVRLALFRSEFCARHER